MFDPKNKIELFLTVTLLSVDHVHNFGREDGRTKIAEECGTAIQSDNRLNSGFDQADKPSVPFNLGAGRLCS